MSAKGYRPVIRPKKLGTSVPLETIRNAVQKIQALKKNSPADYEAMVKKNANTVVRIVPG